MPAPLNHSTGVHGAGAGGGHYSSDLNGAQENLMKSNPSLRHPMLLCLMNEVLAPCPAAVLLGYPPWSSHLQTLE